MEEDLRSYEKNIRSQFGEDGVIAEIFERIGTGNKLCVEFGAWDGEYLCNTYNLFVNGGWKAILIESDAVKCAEMTKKFKEFNTIILNRFVRASGTDSLDNILKEQKISEKIDLLSIDIDGDDYYIFENLISQKPRVVVIEYNPTIPHDLAIIQKPGQYFGSSALSMLNLAHKKGYKLAHVTETNLLLVDESEFVKLRIDEQQLNNFRFDHCNIRLFSSYDGRNFIARKGPYGFKSIYNRMNRIEKLVFKLLFEKKLKPSEIIANSEGVNEVFTL